MTDREGRAVLAQSPRRPVVQPVRRPLVSSPVQGWDVIVRRPVRPLAAAVTASQPVAVQQAMPRAAPLRSAPPHSAVQTVVVAPLVQKSELDMTFVSEKQLKSLKDHVRRMLETGGHSWATGEHGEILQPAKQWTAKKWAKASTSKPIGLFRDSAQQFVPLYHDVQDLLWFIYNSRPITAVRRALRPLIPARFKRLPGAVKHAHKWQVHYFGLLVIAVVALPVISMVRNDLRAERYVLSSATKQLVGEPVVSLDKQLIYNPKSGTYSYNPAAANGIQAPTDGTGDSGVSIGGSKYYGVNLAKLASNGQTFTDAQTKLSFSLIPDFGMLDGKHEAGHVVYPISGGQAIYTLKDNGLKEDVVITQPTSNATLKYKLQLPDSLEAKLQPDGSIGIYSADPSLFGNISYGSSSDQAAVAKARVNGAKTNLVFQIPAPIITQSRATGSTGKAAFKLSDNELTVTASNLAKLTYPISIDPSVVVNSANSFLSGNNEDSNAAINTSSISRSPLTGGTLSSGWTATINSLSGTLNQLVAVVSNGYVYAFGTNNAGSSVYTYATISASGVLGTFLPLISDPYDARNAQTVTYNGFVYLIGGINASNVVYYAKAAANGSLAWTPSSTNLTSGRCQAGATVYNGHIYVAGGATGTILTGCSTPTNTTESATIKADGSLSTWTATTSMPYTAQALSLAATNGRVYLYGGYDGNSTYFGTVYYAAITATGALGAWTATSATPTGGQYNNVVIANNYFYVLGGSNAATTTYVAPIYANGAVGPFQTTAVLPKARVGAGIIAYGGSILLLGGSNALGGGNTSYADNTSALIDPGGYLGTFGATGTGTGGTSGTYAATGLSAMASVAYNGYLYLIGGINASSNALSSAILYAKVNADGSLGTWAQTSQSMTMTRFGASAAVYNGYLYVNAGSNTTSTYTASTEYAPIASNGNITTAFTASSNTCFSATPLGCDDYNIGGAGSQTPSSGNPGMAYSSSVAYNGYLYILGGRLNTNSNSLSTVWYSPLGTNGAPGIWKSTTAPMELPRAVFSATVYNGYVYIAGGIGQNGYASTLTYAKLQSNGDITSWIVGPNLVAAMLGPSVFVNNGYVYVTGGINETNGTYSAVTQYSAIGASGAPGTLTTTSPIPAGEYNGNIYVYNGYVYTAGGCTSQGVFTYLCASSTNTLNTVAYAPINNGGGGSSGTWTSGATTMVTPRYDFSSLAYNGYLYALGGNSGGSFTSTTEFAPLNGDGSVGTWTATTAYQTSGALGAKNPGFAVYNGYIYKLAGQVGSTSAYGNDVQYAAVCTGNNTTTTFSTNCTTSSTPGSLSSWSFTGNSSFSTAAQIGGLVTGRASFGAGAYGGYLYAVGGCTHNNNIGNYCDTLSNSLEYAPINTNGTVGTWTTDSHPFTAARQRPAFTIYNGYVYLMGGCIALSGSTCATDANDTQYAKLSNGPLASDSGCGASWCNGPSFSIARDDFSAAASNGYLYISSGNLLGSGTIAGDTQYAPIGSSGSPGYWTTASTPATNATFGQGSVISNGQLYIVGGCKNTALNCSGGIAGNVQYSPLQMQAHVADYSRVIDLGSTIGGSSGGDAELTGYGLSTTTTNGTISLCSSSASGSGATPGVFGSSTCNSNFTNGITNGFIKNLSTSLGRYAFVYIMIDDSQSASFPDTSASSVNEVDVFFHASPSRRLRGGQTFTNSTSGTPSVNQLDTQGSP